MAESDYESIASESERGQVESARPSTSTTSANLSKGKGKAAAKPKRGTKASDAEIKRRSTKACESPRTVQLMCPSLIVDFKVPSGITPHMATFVPTVNADLLKRVEEARTWFITFITSSSD